MKTHHKKRCHWCEGNDLYEAYHDQEWGVPVHDDRILFEMINLEGAQAGLSWITVLKKRENYRKAFDQFQPKKIIKYNSAKKATLLKNEGIIRNRLKINAVIENAKAFLQIQKELGNFERYIWSFVDHKPLQNSKKQKGVEKSVIMSKDLKKRGFRFVGPTICYAFMQAVGMINDHSMGCFKRYVEK